MTALEENPGAGRELIFPASRFWVIFAFLVFVGIDFFLMGYLFPLLGWAFFVLCLIAFTRMLWPGKFCLKLDADGFEICDPLGNERIRWQDVTRFYVNSSGKSNGIGIAYRKEYIAQRRWWKPARGAKYGIPCVFYAASLEEILSALKQWHARYGGAGVTQEME